MNNFSDVSSVIINSPINDKTYLQSSREEESNSEESSFSSENNSVETK